MNFCPIISGNIRYDFKLCIAIFGDGSSYLLPKRELSIYVRTVPRVRSFLTASSLVVEGSELSIGGGEIVAFSVLAWGALIREGGMVTVGRSFFFAVPCSVSLFGNLVCNVVMATSNTEQMPFDMPIQRRGIKSYGRN